MKVFRMIGMVLLAVFMSANFASCSNEDDAPTEEDSSIIQPIDEKKLVRIIKYNISEYNTSGSLSSIIEFKYENKNVVEAHIRHASSQRKDTVKYVWNSNESLTWKRYPGPEYECTLTNGKITDIGSLYLDYDKDGNIKEYGYLNNGEKNIKRSYTWTNGQLSLMDSGSWFTTFQYNGQTCKGFFPLLKEYTRIGFYDYPDDGVIYNDYIFMAQPELLGIRTNSLPTKISYSGGGTGDFEYEFEADGYVAGFLDISYGSRYEFVWE